MKIAFVNQPIDTILPPYQTSVGACTYGVASAIAKSCEVIVYGTKEKNSRITGSGIPSDVNFRFFPSSRTDRLLDRVRHLRASMGGSSSPASTSVWNFPQFGREVALDLKNEHCDVIHLQHCSAYIPVIRALNPSAKIVLHLHAEWFSQNDPETLRERLQHIDLLTTVSNYVTRKTQRAFPSVADRCETTYNGIDDAEFAREKVYNKGKEKLLLYAGAVSPHKGLHVLIDAFNLVAPRYPDVHLKVIGFQGNYPPEETFDAVEDRALLKTLAPFYARSQWQRIRERLFARQRSSEGTYLSYLRGRISPALQGRVTFPGMVPRSELMDGYYAADVFVFPPIWNEGFGIPPVEAMAAGVPVVASRSGAVTETVRDCETGYLVDKNDVQGTAAAIIRLLENDELAERMGRAGRKRVMERFTWERVGQDLHRRYRRLCGQESQILPMPPMNTVGRIA